MSTKDFITAEESDAIERDVSLGEFFTIESPSRSGLLITSFDELNEKSFTFKGD